MSDLLIKFAVSLKRYELPEPIPERHGAHFARWLPAGKQDALSRKISESIRVRLWFERYGEVGDTYIEFDLDKKEVDPDVMRRQAVLDAGPLFGEVSISGLPGTQLKAVEENRQGEEAYERLGKTVVQKIVDPQVDRFIKILRRNFGQYWIRPYRRWDAREVSLGRHCYLRDMQWSTDGGDTWSEFLPNEPGPQVIEFEASLFRPVKVLTRNDWKGLGKIWRSEYEPSFGAELLQRAHEQLRLGNVKFALLEGVTALEVAIEEFTERRIGGDEKLSHEVKAFLDLGLKSQVAVLTRSGDLVAAQDAIETCEAIELRHQVIHEGVEVEEEKEDLVWTLLNTIAELLYGPTFRFPSGRPGQALYSDENWSEIAMPELELDDIGLGADGESETETGDQDGGSET